MQPNVTAHIFFESNTHYPRLNLQISRKIMIKNLSHPINHDILITINNIKIIILKLTSLPCTTI